MRRNIVCLPLVLAGAIFAAPLRAQEGHPLVGSWHGEWGPPGSAARMDLTVIMDWDGSVITGLVNPVTDRAPLENAELDSGTWTVRFEVEVRDNAGNRVRCRADGQLDNLGSDRRTLAGTWSCGATEAEFELTRDRDY